MGVTDSSFWPAGLPTLVQSGVPRILASSATAITATGAVSGATALPYVPLGVVQVFMFLGTLMGANQLYYARYSSTSAFQLYTDAAGTVTPTGLTAGAYAGGTAEAGLLRVVLPGGILGPNGSLMRQFLLHSSATGASKILRTTLGGTLPAQGYGFASAAGIVVQFTVFNCGSYSIQRAINGTDGSSSAAIINGAVDTTLNQTVTATGQLTSAADYLMISAYNFHVRPGA